MRSLRRPKQFKKDYKRESKSHADLDEILRSAIEKLLQGESMPPKMVDHALHGNWKGYRECHLKPDLLLIYMLADTELTLVRLGSHSELF